MYRSRRRRTAVLLLASALAGGALCYVGSRCEWLGLWFLGALALVPAFIAADLGFIRLLERYCPLRLEWSLTLAAGAGLVCLIVRCVTGCPWLGVLGLFLVLPIVLLWTFWPMAVIGLWVAQRATEFWRRLGRCVRGK